MSVVLDSFTLSEPVFLVIYDTLKSRRFSEIPRKPAGMNSIVPSSASKLKAKGSLVVDLLLDHVCAT